MQSLKTRSHRKLHYRWPKNATNTHAWRNLCRGLAFYFIWHIDDRGDWMTIIHKRDDPHLSQLRTIFNTLQTLLRPEEDLFAHQPDCVWFVDITSDISRPAVSFKQLRTASCFDNKKVLPSIPPHKKLKGLEAHSTSSLHWWKDLWKNIKAY